MQGLKQSNSDFAGSSFPQANIQDLGFGVQSPAWIGVTPGIQIEAKSLMFEALCFACIACLLDLQMVLFLTDWFEDYVVQYQLAKLRKNLCVFVCL